MSLPSIPFHHTKAGRIYYEVTLPELVKQLTKLNEKLTTLVEVMDASTKERIYRKPNAS